MLKIGCHLSVSSGYVAMIKEAIDMNANTFAYFTRNPRGGKAKAVDMKDIDEFNKICIQNNFSKLVAHAPYTMNPCSSKPETREFAKEIFADDLKRMELTPNNYYNFHPGSHTGQGNEEGIGQIVDMLNSCMNENMTTTVLLEGMAGKGTEIGNDFKDLALIIERVNFKNKIGVCLDTCHLYDSGHDIVSNLDEVLENFDKTVGLGKLKAMHLNDSKNPFNSHKDRHEKIGSGTLGIETFEKIINHPQLKDLPFILETPNEFEGYKKEIEILRGLYRW